MHNLTCEYVSSNGVHVNLLSYPYFIEDLTPFFNYSHSVLTSRGKIVGFSKSDTESREIVINVAQASRSETGFRNSKEMLFSIFESDVIAQSPGFLRINGYGLYCYFVSEDIGMRYDEASQSTFNVIWDSSENWTKVIADKSFDLTGNEQSYIPIQWTTPAQFSIRIVGSGNIPHFSIGTNVYKLTTAVESGKTLTIDSLKNSVVCNGENWFNFLDRSGHPFQELPIYGANYGTNLDVVNLSSSNLSFSILVIEERRIPKWN